jgi:hypothetical protein
MVTGVPASVNARRRARSDDRVVQNPGHGTGRSAHLRSPLRDAQEPRVVDGDPATLHEPSCGAFEGFLADPEHAANLIGGRAVADVGRRRAAEEREQTVRVGLELASSSSALARRSSATRIVPASLPVSSR